LTWWAKFKLYQQFIRKAASAAFLLKKSSFFSIILKKPRHMYTVKTDIEKNRLFITLAGFLPASEAADIKIDIMNEVSKLSPGFDIINDISNFRLGLDETVNILNDTIDFLISKKVNRIIRVVGSSRAGLIQMAQYTKKTEDYKTSFVPSLEEAEEILNKKSK
jgi:hypothetical protein